MEAARLLAKSYNSSTQKVLSSIGSLTAVKCAQICILNSFKMKKIFLLAATVALLTACTREPLFEMRELSNEAAKAKKLKEEVADAKAIQWQIEPISSNPLRFRTVLSLQLNNWDKLKKEATKANWNYLQLSVEGTPITIDSKEEFSQPTNNKFTLFFNRINLETGIVYFENKEQVFSLLFPENSYALASARLIVKL